MTINLLKQLIEDNNISKDVKLLSNSAWGGGETEIGGVWYSEKYNVIIFTQHYVIRYTHKDNECRCLYRENNNESYL